jgi:hypothetical protein
MSYLRFVLTSALVLLSTSGVRAHEHHQEALAQEMSQLAQGFLASLNEEDRATAAFPLTSEERENFHYVPLVRKGMVFKSMKASQRAAALQLLHSALSSSGSYKVVHIMELEKVLYELENHDPKRDSELYYVAIFGEPGKNPWGWRFEGHHVSVNQTITDEGISGSPLFFGANPGHVTTGEHAGLRVLAEEEDKGRAFVESLTSAQRQKAVINTTAIREILTSQNSEVSPLDNDGIAYGELTSDQQTQLRRLLQYYLDRHEQPIAKAALDRIESHGIENLVFAWAGSIDLGEKHYYRIQGPSFVIEYANVQNNANHHHTVFRDFTHDFGRDVLREHYRDSH